MSDEEPGSKNRSVDAHEVEARGSAREQNQDAEAHGGGREQENEVRQTLEMSVRAEDAHLDAWNVDRVIRSSFPPSAPTAAFYPQVDLCAPTLGLLRSYELIERVCPQVGGDTQGDALELAGRKSVLSPVLDLTSEMAECFALGDFSGSLRAAELLLGQEPEHELARYYARESCRKLESLFVSRLTSSGRVPQLAVPESEVRWLGLDSRMTFLLSRIDGTSDYETVVDLSGMPRLSALRCLIDLVEATVIRLV